MKEYDAITLPWAIYVKESEANAPKTLINHEMVHMEQRAQIGTITFYVRYLGYWAKGIWKYRNLQKAYMSIPFEIEAYAKQDQNQPLL